MAKRPINRLPVEINGNPKSRPISSMRDGELMIYAGRGADWARAELDKRITARQALHAKGSI